MHASRKELEAVYRRMRPAADLLDKPKDTNYYLAKQLADQLNADRVGVYKVPDDVWSTFHGALIAAIKLKPTPNINLHGVEGFELVQSVCADVEPKALDQFIRCHIGLHLSELMHGTDKADVLAGLLKVAASARTIQLEVMPMAKRMVRNADAIRPDRHHDGLVQLTDRGTVPVEGASESGGKKDRRRKLDDQHYIDAFHQLDGNSTKAAVFFYDSHGIDITRQGVEAAWNRLVTSGKLTRKNTNLKPGNAEPQPQSWHP